MWELYKSHIELIETVSNKISGRFTFSPMSIISIWKEMQRFLSQDYGVRINNTRLYTTKASSDTYTSKNMPETMFINNFMEYNRTSHLEIILYRLLTKFGPIYLSIRMFDKDHVGGNREISILTNQFRILQSVVEDFYRKVGLNTRLDYLDRRDKISFLTSTMESSMNSKYRFYASVDQTRWGSNFNTNTFGLMSLLLSESSLDAIMIGIISFISAFKTFEVSLQIPILFKQVDATMSMIGKVAESHMGQGVFHYTSSSGNPINTENI